MRKRFLGAFAVLGLCALAAGAQVQRVDDDVRAAVASGLELREFTIQRLALPAENVEFVTDLTFGGLEYAAWVTPQSFRAPGATLTLAGEGGALREIPLPAPLTVRAQIEGVPEARAAGSRMGGGLHLTVALPGAIETEIWTVQPLTDIMPGADPALHVVHRADDMDLKEHWICGVNEKGAGKRAPEAAGTGGSSRAFLVCELATEADYEYYSVYNGSSEANTIADIDTIIARISAVYEGQCNVTFQIPHYNIWTTANDPYTSSDPGTRLGQFRNWWNSNKGGINRDLAHMFTGVNLDGSVIGVAYLSVVCSNSSAYGLVQSRFTNGQNARGALSAHEIGHNFSAGHCDGNGDCHIMCSGLGGCNGLGNPAFFGQPSANKIANYAANRSCLDEDGIVFPFLEEWASTTIDSNVWVANSGGTVVTTAENEPSAPYSLNLDGTDSIESGSIDLTGVVETPYVSFFTQHKGVENGESLVAEYRDINGQWQTIDTIVSNGTDQTTFAYHVYPIDFFAWGPDYAVRFRALGSDGTDDWYVDNISVGYYPGNPLPFYEPFATSNLNTSTIWESVNGAAASTAADNEPSDPYSMNLDGTDSAQTFTLLMSTGPIPAYLSFYTEHKGVESGKSLVIEYINDFGGWSEFMTITSNGTDQTKFQFHQAQLAADAYHDSFALRIRAQGANGTDDWYVDDIRIGDEFTPPDDCVADFNGDGVVNTQDVLAFLNAWNAQDPKADINGDGVVNTQDVLAFLNLWNVGCG